MKKIFSLLIGAIMLIGLNSCNKDLKVTDANIVGEWAMTAMIVDGMESPANGQVWGFNEDHTMYVSDGGYQKVDAGEWRLEDKTLYLDFIPFPMLVAKLTSKQMELKAYDEEYDVYMFSYTFDKVK